MFFFCFTVISLYSLVKIVKFVFVVVYLGVMKMLTSLPFTG